MNHLLGSQTSSTSSFESFGNYLFLKRLAAGGMAEVFLARPATQDGNGRVLVIKRILPHVANNHDFHKMFQTEIQVIMGFNHPHTVQLHDSGEFNRQPYIAMEYIEGKNLKELMSKLTKKNMKMPVPVALGLIMQAAAGLSYAHTFVNKVTGEAVNAIHRDISPHNLLLSYEGNLKVIDFGIAKAATSIHEPTRVGTLKGKIAYLSPEQINGQPVDARSDIFALGIVAWELLTLSRPFCKDSDNEMTIIGKISECDKNVTAPSTVNAEVPAALDEVILKALRKNPDERYASAAEFQKALRDVMMRFYPDHSYADTGRLVHNLFEQEIISERREVQELNRQAQMDLTPPPPSDTVIIDDRTSSGVTKSLFSSFKKTATPEMSQVDVRLMQIEMLMKQKAQQKHYLLFIFYVVSLVAIKMDDSFSLIYNLVSPNKVVEQTISEPSKRSPAKSKQRSAQATPSKNKKRASQ